MEAGSANTHSPASSRLESLDALRGFDMLWITGLGPLGGALARFDGGAAGRFLARQLHHAEWEGFHFWDLIFPLFVFMIGVALVFSVRRLVETHGRIGALPRIVRRTALMFALGVLSYGGLSVPLADVRWLGVLQRLALCYFCTSLLLVFLRPRSLVVAWAILLLGYWALLTFVSVPGFGRGDYAEGHNLTNWIDRVYLPGHKYDGDHDPEGLLSTVPAIASCLLGVFAGLLLRDSRLGEKQRVRWLAIAGVVLLTVGYAWGCECPIVKKIWTPSYVCVAGGWSVLLLALFYLVIDLCKFRTWATPLVWIGTNALTIYVVCSFVDVRKIAERFAGGDVAAWFDARWHGLGGLIVVLVNLALCLSLCRFLYRRKFFFACDRGGSCPQSTSGGEKRTSCESDQCCFGRV